jgi:hypothetical protein
MAVCLHEAAHAWLGADPDPATAVGTREMSIRCDAALLGVYYDPELMRRLLDHERRHEDQADALARAWGAEIEGSAHGDNAQTIARAASSRPRLDIGRQVGRAACVKRARRLSCRRSRTRLFPNPSR